MGGPGPRARHRPRSFRPDADAVDRAIARVHEASDGRYRYLGTWHTHPFGRAAPSTDIAAARAISEEEHVRLSHPLLIILATWPTRRTFRDRDLCAFLWDALAAVLILAPLRILRVDERRHAPLAREWSEVVT